MLKEGQYLKVRQYRNMLQFTLFEEKGGVKFAYQQTILTTPIDDFHFLEAFFRRMQDGIAKVMR